ncbi:MAG: BCD family MFS transporter [Hyphomicrobiaceae bacterium]|jgi:BCD family chlorophyll transporter-like MFS transporter
MTAATLGWLGIVRLGLVQTALGAVVVLTTSTLNRVMVVELALPAMLPGLLVALHYAVQMTRPRWGHGSDVGGRRTPWIIGGIGVLAAGGVLAAVATALMEIQFHAGVALAVVAFTLIGIGVGAAGTSLLVLLAKRVDPGRRAAAATIVWVMMIAGFIVTTAIAGHHLDPFSTTRLVVVTSVVSVAAFALAIVAVWGVEGHGTVAADPAAKSQLSFRTALAEVWDEPQARRFTIFVALSMFAYSAQDLILEPYAGTVFGLTPGQSTKLSGVQHGGVLLGMVMVALLATGLRGVRIGSLRAWTVGGCLASAVALLAIVAGGYGSASWPIETLVFCLGLANGAFAVAAIGSMMALAGEGRPGREGVRMGLWGAAQAIAFGLGGVTGAGASDIVRLLTGSTLHGYTSVFVVEAGLFVVAAVLAHRVGTIQRSGGVRAEPRLTNLGQSLLPAGSEV